MEKGKKWKVKIDETAITKNSNNWVFRNEKKEKEKKKMNINLKKNKKWTDLKICVLPKKGIRKYEPTTASSDTNLNSI